VADESVQVEPDAEPAAPPSGPEIPPPTTGPDAPPPPVDPVLARYRADMRRSRTVYYAIVGAIVIGLSVWVAVAWSRGEISHATLHTFAPVPPSVGIAEPAATQNPIWQTSDRIALGQPQWGGTIVTFNEHTVGGRNARTGARTWSYTRTDRTVCTAAQLTGTVIAVYENKGNCDELSAFDSDSGRRRWTRTLDMDGMPINGRPSYQVTPFTMLIASSSVIYAIDPVTGYNRWTYSRYGCAISHVVLGGAGALFSQDCSTTFACKGQKFCALGPQLVLRNGSDGRDDKSTKNPDKIIWNLVGVDDVPVSADSDLISAVSTSGNTLHVYDPDSGNRIASLALAPATAVLGPITAISTDTAEIVWLAGQTYAIKPDGASVLWRVDCDAPPVVVSTTHDSTPSLGTARITVPTSSGIGIVDGNTGQIAQSFTVGTPRVGTRVYSLGDGFLVAGPTGITAYR
jgi:hypothetical protein